MVLTRSQCANGSENFDAFGASHITALCQEFERSTITPYSILPKLSKPRKQKVLRPSLLFAKISNLSCSRHSVFVSPVSGVRGGSRALMG